MDLSFAIYFFLVLVLVLEAQDYFLFSVAYKIYVGKAVGKSVGVICAYLGAQSVPLYSIHVVEFCH